MIDQADTYTLLDEHIGGGSAISLRWPIYIVNNDSYSKGSHKWFLGPKLKAIGILYMRKESVSNLCL